MSLLRLPPETLTQIFDQIGSYFFREDLGRLTVCNQWFEFALPACFKCITLSQKTLWSLIASGILDSPKDYLSLPTMQSLLSLENLSVLVLDLPTDLPGITSAAHAKRCGSQAGGLLQLIADIQEQAEVLATRMASPKTIRILTHSIPQFETQSFDVLTGKTMLLDHDMAWDEDGKTVKEDSEPESELLDDDFLLSQMNNIVLTV
ncbi:uncharacterized protein F4817DRAFT_27443 [Daldinia loculata]|uniref:uncharacterized protein n=1 Tax=Daldinia loculata TaxID=103429 RepID=UPI0020C41CE8|nr:uncharacterized protein F4817DRAFT_27443 [Daldinia loculata]KAI1649642.1 hypothetical protein F4817DRAFT_27443 [Daldinia loculata]